MVINILLLATAHLSMKKKDNTKKKHRYTLCRSKAETTGHDRIKERSIVVALYS